MKLRSSIICLWLALAVAAAPWGVNPAHAIDSGATKSAGPAGVTFFANTQSGGATGTALKKFVDSLPGLGPANKNNLGNFIPIAQKITPSPFGTDDYYEIGLFDFTQRLHSNLPVTGTKLRGYRDLSPVSANNDGKNHYLGPLIIARKGTPVRIKFTNNLGTGAAGNLFLPVDPTIMGAGPYNTDDPWNRGNSIAGTFTQNRANVHLHGGFTPWISDGTPHQWLTPAGEGTNYPKGASFQNVPDMVGAGPGQVPGTPVDGMGTFYYPNDQSGRLMFYHDHAYGLTRLNVYAGEAAGYLLTDPVEDGLIAAKVIPNQGGGVYNYGIPLIIQDKSFVPADVAIQDSKWDTANWGGQGNLWFPHVYEPNQDPIDPANLGANPYGRWDYGPWFWPVFPAKPLPGPAAKPQDYATSAVPEAFMDTMLVNGAAYPYLNVNPTAYRFRILNACNDRMLNLQLYIAVQNNAEVKMVPAVYNKKYPPTWPTDGRAGGVPAPANRGPNMIQIGTEGGLLPAPYVVPNQPVNYDYNRRNIVVLNVLDKALFMGPAERADVIIDFSKYAGKTIVLYNDAPAPVPAFDPRYDYYTGNPDQTAEGGAPSTLKGFGPNTRTIMVFKVGRKGKTPAFNLAALQAALPAAFAASFPVAQGLAPIVAESAYNAPYGGAFTNTYSTIQANTLSYTQIDGTPVVNAPLQPKTIQELFDPYGRMNSTLGVELPFTTANVQTTLPFMYIDPPTEGAVATSVPWLGAVPINNGDTQLWKITHNGVDTHAIHFHLVNVQVINRVGWDGAIRPPDANELGWKETVRMNPLEDIVVAAKFTLPTTPVAWGPLPVSNRLLDVTGPVGLSVGPDYQFSGFDALNNPVPNLSNNYTDFGHEYVWHCHLLGHEENDMMRAMAVTP